MTRLRALPWLLLFPVLLAGLGSGCGSSTMSRVEANRAAYESWPAEIREAVLANRVLKGMTPEMVRMARGKPSQIRKGDGSMGEEEIWVYESGTGMGRPQLTVGGSVGGVGVMGGAPLDLGSPAEVEEVVFKDGVVLKSY